ncbi:unnamed protein product [Effrenium voratum]|nr:unnamed protein product [Effrenium voratum]
MPNDLPTIRSANNVIQPSLDESPPASPTDKNLHSSKSDNALSTFLNDLPDSSRRLNWVERLKVYMDYMAGALVLMNSVAMLLEFELEGRQTGKFIGLLENVQAEAEWTATLKFFRALDAVFVFTFLAEWLVRVYLDRKKFLKDFANWFDTLCVFSGIADLILRVSVDSTASRSVVVLRLMRALKSLRAIRMVRSLRFFRGLRVLVQACQCFLPSLCWSMVLLGVFMTMGALMMGNLLQAFILDENLELADRQWLWSRYGTAYRATYTLFEITFAGNWPTSVRPVLDMASHAFVFFFACLGARTGVRNAKHVCAEQKGFAHRNIREILAANNPTTSGALPFTTLLEVLREIGGLAFLAEPLCFSQTCTAA